MPRRPPIDPVGTYHVSTRANYGAPIFETTDHCEMYLRLFTKSVEEFGWVVLDWCLIWNHHHFLIRLTNGGLSEGMRKANHGFSRRMNAIGGQTNRGHLVRHGFHAGAIASEAHLFQVCRYIAHNPVAAGLCARPEDWRWSGCRATLGLAHPRPFHAASELLALFGPTPGSARSAYRRHLQDAPVSNGHDPFPGNGYESVTRAGARVVESQA